MLSTRPPHRRAWTHRAVGLDPNVKNLFRVWSASEQRVIDLPTSRSTTSAWRDCRYSPRSNRGRAKRTLTRKRQRVPERLGLRDHHHWSLINELLSQYDVVCLPPSRRTARQGLGSGTNESMFSIAHGLLLARLTYKAEPRHSAYCRAAKVHDQDVQPMRGAEHAGRPRSRNAVRTGDAPRPELGKNILVKEPPAAVEGSWGGSAPIQYLL